MKHILFDLDGTLTDSKVGITKSTQYALSRFGIHIENLDELEHMIGPHISHSFVETYGFSEEDTNLAITYFREYFAEKGIFENEPYPNIEKTLAALTGQGFKLGIATSKPTIFAEKILKHFDLDPYFTHIMGSNLDNTRTHKDEIISACIELFGNEAKEGFVMIGDREHDILGAKKVGIPSIGVLYGYGSREELKKAGADRIVGSHEELLEIDLAQALDS